MLIPPIVHKELYGKIGSESDQIDQALSDFIRVVKSDAFDTTLGNSLINLGEGEKH